MKSSTLLHGISATVGRLASLACCVARCADLCCTNRSVLFNAKRFRALIALSAIFTSVTAFAEVVYKSVDRSGRITYSDHVPLDASNFTVLRIVPNAGVLPTQTSAAAGTGGVGKTGSAVADGVFLPDGKPASTTLGDSKQAGSSSGGGGPGGGAGGSSSPKAPSTSTASTTSSPPTKAEIAAAVPTIIPPRQPAPTAPPSPPSATSPVGDVLIAGIGTHFGQGRGRVPMLQDLIQVAGLGSFRDDVYWASVEKVKGQLSLGQPDVQHLLAAIDTGRSEKIDPLIVLAYGNQNYDKGLPVTDEGQNAYVRYATFVATQLKGKVFRYEIWNEWNINSGGAGGPQTGDPTAYARLLSKVYPALKAVDPNITVFAGAVVAAQGDLPWLQAILAAGAATNMDALSVHPYNYWFMSAGTPENAITWMNRCRTLLDKYPSARNLPIYVTEMGWPTFQGKWGVTSEVQANYVMRFLLLAYSTGFVKGVWWYNLQDDGVDPLNPEQNFGVIRADYTQKPAYCALRETAKMLSSSRSVDVAAQAGGIWLAKVAQSDGTYTYAVWSQNNDDTVAIILKTSDNSNATLQVGDLCRPADYAVQGGAAFRLTATGFPLVIQSNASNLTVEIAQ